jgi:hypothetical protein
MQINKFFNTMVGSYIKVSLSAIITFYIAEGSDLFSFDLAMAKKLLSVGLGSLLPVFYNALNPHDKRYGKKPKPKAFKPLL